MLLSISTPIIIDIVLCLIIFTCGLVGIKKGFLGSIISIFGWLGGIIIAWLLKDIVANLLENWFALTTKIGYTLNVIISFISVFVLVKILVFVINYLIKFILKNNAFGKINKLLGFILGLAKGVIYICTILVLLTLLQNIPSVSEKVTPIINQTVITKNSQQLVEKFILTKINIKNTNESTENVIKL